MPSPRMGEGLWVGHSTSCPCTWRCRQEKQANSGLFLQLFGSLELFQNKELKKWSMLISLQLNFVHT